ncbi:hypothetical protein CYMTET_25521 [Cymbomonas tetramitiformis]|uniref:Fe2OG dioxygenase domain-containing protein n=1 Tax=Cymbomonas tetramitiformis TaxID=36881 RepID=A0AAE0FTM5_9CHLO|nr:hypothetical protein CYMTET_25521 [Cymbomonas tetramitiformis]
MLQEPISGGYFELTPFTRHKLQEHDPKVEADVSRLISQDGDNVASATDQKTSGCDVRRLDFTEGTLSIFGGRQSLHRVTPVFGERDRLVAVLCWAKQQNVTNSPAVRKLFWGREG